MQRKIVVLFLILHWLPIPTIHFRKHHPNFQHKVDMTSHIEIIQSVKAIRINLISSRSQFPSLSKYGKFFFSRFFDFPSSSARRPLEAHLSLSLFHSGPFVTVNWLWSQRADTQNMDKRLIYIPIKDLNWKAHSTKKFRNWMRFYEERPPSGMDDDLKCLFVYNKQSDFAFLSFLFFISVNSLAQREQSGWRQMRERKPGLHLHKINTKLPN